jgi:hypothetical protein
MLRVDPPQWEGSQQKLNLSRVSPVIIVVYNHPVRIGIVESLEVFWRQAAAQKEDWYG